jgi:hypothetical protein
MYHMFAIRSILVSTLVFAAVPPAVLHAAPYPVQYVGGTVKSIPVNSAGAFNFDDAKELRFHYNGSVYRLPYDQITGTEIEKADVKHVMRVIPAQSLIFTHRKRTLVINYTDATGAAGTLNFELPAYRAADAQETIAAKKTPPPAGIVEAPWWGDHIWKTARNQAAWDAQAVLNAQAVQAAQAAQSAQATAAQNAPSNSK